MILELHRVHLLWAQTEGKAYIAARRDRDRKDWLKKMDCPSAPRDAGHFIQAVFEEVGGTTESQW